METQMISPELINYVRAIAIERGLAKHQLTKVIVGELLKEAVARMDRATTRFIESRDARLGMAEAIFFNQRIA